MKHGKMTEERLLVVVPAFIAVGTAGFFGTLLALVAMSFFCR